MIELPMQLGQDHKTLSVMSQEDLERLKTYKAYQVLRAKLYGIEKPRSLPQLGLYWNRCTYIAEQLSDHNQQFTKNDIDFEVKIKVAKEHPSMIKRFKAVDGVVYMEPISISFPNMKHLEACNYFSLAWPVMAPISCTVAPASASRRAAALRKPCELQ